jgi:hypothetical protein
VDTTKAARPRTVTALIVIELISSVVAIACGLTFMTDPSGKSVGVNVEMLEDTPIGDYTLVGILLFAGFGIIPLAISWGLVTKKPWSVADFVTKWSSRTWAWTGALIIAVIEVFWMILEIPFIGVFPITVVWAAVQLGIIGILYSRTVNAFYAKPA